MKTSISRHAQGLGHAAARHAKQRLRGSSRTRRTDAKDTFPDREEDAMEYDSIARDFAQAHREALDADDYN
jgi:hypothetical protein